MSAAWMIGDVVQTIVPYDDVPVTVVRMADGWHPVPTDGGEGTGLQSDTEVDSWLADGAAHVVIRQTRERDDVVITLSSC